MNSEKRVAILSSIAEMISQATAPSGIFTKIIAIDGCGGAGKSTFAQELSRYLGNCSIVHTDDFASWENSQGWYPRMIEQFLEPMRRNETARFQKYDWNKKQLGDWVIIASQKFVILEGVSSSRKEFRPFLSFKIFVKTDRDLRLRRGLERDGQQAQEQWLKWMREEDDYVARDNPEAIADFII